MENLLTAREVAKLLSVNPNTVKRLVARRELTGSKVGATYRFGLSDVEAYLAKHTLKAK